MDSRFVISVCWFVAYIESIQSQHGFVYFQHTRPGLDTHWAGYLKIYLRDTVLQTYLTAKRWFIFYTGITIVYKIKYFYIIVPCMVVVECKEIGYHNSTFEHTAPVVIWERPYDEGLAIMVWDIPEIYYKAL